MCTIHKVSHSATLCIEKQLSSTSKCTEPHETHAAPLLVSVTIAVNDADFVYRQSEGAGDTVSGGRFP